MAHHAWSAKLNSLVAISALLGSHAAFANVIELQTWWAGAGNVTLTLTNGVNYHTGANPVSFTESGGSGGFQAYDATTKNTFEAWCVDIFHDFGWGNPASTTDVKQTAASLFTQVKADDLGRLYTRHHLAIDGHGSTANDSSAFQLAVWEIVNETGNSYGLASGAFTATGAGAATADSWLADLTTNHAASLYSASVWVVQNNSISANGMPTWGAQDVAVFASVPEPSTLGLLGLSLAGLGATGRRKQRKAV